jgi:hypothetical protein
MEPVDPRSSPVQVAEAGDPDLDQIVERLGWTPWERLQYLLDMLEFEDLARSARRVDPDR